MIIRTVKDLSAYVRERRKQLGWSQSELGEKIGVRRLWVSQFEAGKTTAHIGLVMRTLRAMDLELQVAEARSPKPGSPESAPVDLDSMLDDQQEPDVK